jgi:CheY-like chemotaxis protein
MADILVVDDSRDCADSMAILLRLWGHNVETASDGRQAIEIARLRRPNFVLLDIGLPELDGYHVATMLRQESPGPFVIIAVTGHAKEEHRRHALAAGCDFHLLKPVNLDNLAALFAGSATRLASSLHDRSGWRTERPGRGGLMD